MNTIYQLPPMLSGSTQQQLGQLRDYLVRIVRQLPTETQLREAVNKSVETTARRGTVETAKAAQEQAGALKALIIKTADVIEHEMDLLETTLTGSYLAKSEFGTYLETNEAYIRATARGVVEEYNFTSQIETASEQIMTAIRGEILRGFIPNPAYNDDPAHEPQYIFGIAVAERIIIVTDEDDPDRTMLIDGEEYSKIDMAATGTLGLYTSTGWQFWIGTQKAGWFDSKDGMLHVPNIVVESSALFGDSWLVTVDGGWGLRYIGGTT